MTANPRAALELEMAPVNPAPPGLDVVTVAHLSSAGAARRQGSFTGSTRSGLDPSPAHAVRRSSPSLGRRPAARGDARTEPQILLGAEYRLAPAGELVVAVDFEYRRARRKRPRDSARTGRLVVRPVTGHASPSVVDAGALTALRAAPAEARSA